MTAHVTHSFFIPDEFSCQESRILSQTYNLAHVLLHRSESDHLFIPIRPLQYLGIIEKDAFWFVDSLAYAVRDNEGGRLIRVSWHPIVDENHHRDSLEQNIDCNVIFYGDDMSTIQTRLCSEFYQAMLQMDQRHRDSIKTDCTVSILPLKIPK